MNILKHTTLLVLCVVFSLLASSANGQTLKFTMEFDTLRLDKYDYRHTVENSTYLRMPYASYKILNPSNIEKIDGKTITQVKLICTDYPKGDDFTLLNNQRLAALFLIAPQLFSNPYIQWTIVYQTGCDQSNVYKYFHGFEIVYRAPYSYKTAEESLREILEGKTQLTDSTILKVMKRNEWKDMTIVSDFTGSMSPYIGQLLLWYNLTINKNKSNIDAFVFFNDGDMKGTPDKVIGKTGGIYHTTEMALDSVLQTALTTIENGGGGDGPENDVEALRYAQKKYKKSKNYILIADNPAPVRDTALIKELDAPVRVIVCGATRFINTQYIDLAYQTKGSIHTIEQDIDDMLHELKDGDILEINGQKYRLVKGRFVPVDKL